MREGFALLLESAFNIEPLGAPAPLWGRVRIQCEVLDQQSKRPNLDSLVCAPE